MGKRPRIEDKKTQAIVVTDPMEYVENLSTLRARQVKAVVERIEFKIWIDQHYNNRAQIGDDNGKRSHDFLNQNL